MDNNDRILDYPQQGMLAVRYGGFWERFAAALIDGIIVGIPSYFVSSMFLPSAAEIMANPEAVSGNLNSYYATQFVMVVLQGLYFAYFESGEKQATFGKQALGLKVTDLNGGRISFLNAYGRYFAKLISALIMLIGYIMQAFTAKKQALHDMIASTLVVKV